MEIVNDSYMSKHCSVIQGLGKAMYTCVVIDTRLIWLANMAIYKRRNSTIIIITSSYMCWDGPCAGVVLMVNLP